jgi:hypothetical protein
VQEAQLDAARRQIVEQAEDRAEGAPPSRPLDEQLLDVGGGDPNTGARARDALVEECVIERPPADEAGCKPSGERFVDQRGALLDGWCAWTLL